MKAKTLIKVFLKCFLLVKVLTVANENDVNFDFNKYFRVNIATNKPTIFEKAVTLYNPHLWPGPNDTSPTPVPTTPSPTKRRFVFGLRRSAPGFGNTGYGYDNNLTQYVPTYKTTAKPIKTIRKYNNVNFDTINSNRNFNFNSRNISRNFTTFRDFTRNEFGFGFRNTSTNQWTLSPNIGLRNFSRDFPYFRDISRDFDIFHNFSNIFTDFKANNKTIKTAFSCENMRYFGYYADIESKCKLFHVCTPDGRKVSFVCPNKLLFNQKLTVCDWSHNVECELSFNYFDINSIKFDNWNKQVFNGRK